jgi:hypothetical protein
MVEKSLEDQIDEDFYFSNLEKEHKLTHKLVKDKETGQLRPIRVIADLDIIRNPAVALPIAKEIEENMGKISNDMLLTNFHFEGIKLAFLSICRDKLRVLSRNLHLITAPNTPKSSRVSEADIEYAHGINVVDLAANLGIEINLLSRPYKCCCPFHEEKTPSCALYDDHFFCFGCKAHGDAIEFYMKINNCVFKTAVTELRKY